MVGTTLDMVIDENGNIVEVANEGSEGGEKFDAMVRAQSKIQSHFSTLSRLLGSVTDQEVKSGDTWQTNLDVDFGSVEGVSTLLGYIPFDGADCAVLYMNGTYHMDLAKSLEAIGQSPDSVGSEYTNAAATQAMYWDYEEELVRCSQFNSSAVIKMKNLESGADVEVPMTASESTITYIKDTPNTLGASKEPKNQAWVLGLFAALVVAAVLALTVMQINKSQKEQVVEHEAEEVAKGEMA